MQTSLYTTFLSRKVLLKFSESLREPTRGPFLFPVEVLFLITAALKIIKGTFSKVLDSSTPLMHFPFVSFFYVNIISWPALKMYIKIIKSKGNASTLENLQQEPSKAFSYWYQRVLKLSIRGSSITIGAARYLQTVFFYIMHSERHILRSGRAAEHWERARSLRPTRWISILKNMCCCNVEALDLLTGPLSFGCRIQMWSH